LERIELQRPIERGPATPAPRRPLVVAVMGLPGVGKSTVARAIERELGLRRVCRDEIRRAMFPRCNYSFVEKRAAFRSVLLAIEINCLLGESSVVDGMTFSRRQDFDQIAALAATLDFDALPLLIDCPPALARARFVRDELTRRAGDERRERAFVDAVIAHFQAPSLATLRIDGSLSSEEVCRLAISEISARIDAVPARI
jgi:predicted kinase